MGSPPGANGASYGDGKTPRSQLEAYEFAFDYCTFMQIDRADLFVDGAEKTPATSWRRWGGDEFVHLKPMPAAARTGTFRGPFGWVQAHQEDVFKFIMFGDECNIHPESTQKIFMKFYGEEKLIDQTCLTAKP